MVSESTLREVIASQRNNLAASSIGVIREVRGTVTIQTDFAIVITGMRRSGKSTLLLQMVKQQKKVYYLNLEDPRLDGFTHTDFLKLESVMRGLYGQGGVYFFDEVQTVPGWERFIRYLVDKKEKVVITGSNASLLSRELGSKLTGRYLQLELFPFSFKEYLCFTGRKPSLLSCEQYRENGGFPEFLKIKNNEILHTLLSDVVMRDIVVRYGIRNADVVRKLLIFLVSNAGKEFSYNALKKMMGIKSVQSVIDYVSFFEDAYLIFTVPKWSYSYRKQLVNPKKVYAIDTGFSGANSVSFSKDAGRSLENLVFLALRRRWKEIFYFQDENECDFVVQERERVVQAIQVCLELNVDNNEREIAGLKRALDFFKLGEGLILTQDQEDEFVLGSKRIIVKPVWKWLEGSKGVPKVT